MHNRKAFLILFTVTNFALKTPASEIIGWGENSIGQATGAPSSSISTGVVTVSGNVLSDAVAIASGAFHALALKNDGSVVGWGGTGAGDTTGFHQIIAISAGYNHSLALKRDGAVIACGVSDSGKKITVPPGLTNVVSVAAGYNHDLALKKEGDVVSWGQGAVPASTLSNIIAISASCNWAGHDLALRDDGTVVEWDTRTGFVEQNSQLSNVVAIAAGWGHSLALKRDGTVFGWGANGSGEATAVPTKVDVTDTRGSSGLVTIGGQVLSDVAAIAAGKEHSLALKRDGTVIAWGTLHGRYPATVPAGLSNVVAIAAGENFCLAITTNRAVADRFRR